MQAIMEKPIIDYQSQYYMDNYSRMATERIDSFGVMYNSDGSEKTLEQLEGGEAEKPQQPKVEPQQPEVP